MASKLKSKDWRSKQWVSLLVIIAAAFMIVANVYLVWDIATTKASASFECRVQQIDYVQVSGNGKCYFPFIQGDDINTTWCALPRDVQCAGVVQDFPLVKAIAKLR